MVSKKATKNDEIFTVDLTLTTYCQIDAEDFVNYCGLLRKHEFYYIMSKSMVNILSNFVAFLENINFNWSAKNWKGNSLPYPSISYAPASFNLASR